MENQDARAARLAFGVGLVLLTLWGGFLAFQVFFWTGMGLRDLPLPLAPGVYRQQFLEMLGYVVAVALVGPLGLITWPLVAAVGWGWKGRRGEAGPR